MSRLRLPAWTANWGENTRRLAHGLAAAGPFLILARALTVAAQIIAGRWMGPREFGKVTLVAATAGILNLLLNLGFIGCVIKFASSEKSTEGQSAVVSTNFWLQLAWGGVCGLTLYALSLPLSLMLRISVSLYAWSLGYASLLALFTFASSALQGVLQFAERGRVEFFYGLATLILFLLGCRFYSARFEIFIGAMSGALLLASAISLYHLRRWIVPAFSRRAAADIVSYTPPVVVFACSGVLLQAASPMILSAMLSTREVGYFGIYTMGSVGVAMVFFQVLNAVLTPLASDPERHAGAWKKFFLLLAPLATFVFIILSVSTVVMLELIGKSYPIVPQWIMFFSAAGTAHVVFFCALALLTIRNTKSAWIGSVGSMIMGTTCLAANLWAVKRFGFIGSAIGLIFGYASGGTWCIYWGWRGLRERTKTPGVR